MQKFLGIIILLVVAGVAAGYFILQKGGFSGDGKGIPSFGTPKQQITITGKAGSEKITFLQSEKMQKVFQKFGLQLNVRKAGSVEMMRESTGQDFLWPASQVDVEFFTSSGGRALTTENIFNSPLVIYSWDMVTEALVKNGIVEQRDRVNYIVDLPKLLNLIVTHKSWKDIGLSQLYGKMIIRTTDPTKERELNKHGN